MNNRLPPVTPRRQRPAEDLIEDADLRLGGNLVPIPTDLTTADVRPATILAALMVQAPGEAYQESVEDSEVVFEAINYAIECLTDEDKFILNAIDHEGITYEELSKRLGVSRTQGWRLHKRSLERLRILLLNHPPVRERLGMEPTWNAAAMHELIAIAGYDENSPGEFDIEQATKDVAYEIELAVLSLDQNRENDAVSHLSVAGATSVLYLRSISQWRLVEMHGLLCSKQSDYGHGNILRFGMVGVMVRASDKAERLKNLLTSRDGAKPANETVLDTFYDVIGYAVIARMLKAETFELQLETSAI